MIRGIDIGGGEEFLRFETAEEMSVACSASQAM